MTIAEISTEVEQIRERWRSETRAERKLDLLELDDLLGELDELGANPGTATDAVNELRGRIEVLMDEIEISVRIEPPPITGYADSRKP